MRNDPTFPIIVKRSKNWERLLHDEIFKRRNQEFVRGVSDCIFTVADIVQACTGVDIAAKYRGKYSDDLEALRFIRNECKDGNMLSEFQDHLENHIGLKSVSPFFAHRLDVGYFISGNDEGACIFTGNGVLSAGLDGLKKRSRGDVIMAWHIPF